MKKIKKLKGKNGEVLEDGRRLKEFITNHCRSLFLSNAGHNMEEVIHCLFVCFFSDHFLIYWLHQRRSYASVRAEPSTRIQAGGGPKSSCAHWAVSEVIHCVQTKVTADMNGQLLQPFTREEVKAALESIGDLKAPGPDGIPAKFFKKFWDVVGEDVQKEVLAVMNGGEMPDGWNETNIAIIPKFKIPERIKDMWLISLCKCPI